MDASIEQLKQRMCEVGRDIWLRGFCAGNEGNHTIRLGGNDAGRFLCTPTRMSKGALSPEDICVIDENGKLADANPNGRQPSSEVMLHLAIYRHRPDANAVVHSHPPHATAFAVAGIPLPEGIHPEAEIFLGRVPTAPFAMPSTSELPASVTAVIDDDTCAVLMGNHGVVCFAADLTDAYHKLEVLDAYCRMLLLARQLGRVNVLSPQQMRGLLEIKQRVFALRDSRLDASGEVHYGRHNDAFMKGLRPQ